MAKEQMSQNSANRDKLSVSPGSGRPSVAEALLAVQNGTADLYKEQLAKMKNQPQDDQTLPQLTNMNTHKKNEIPILDEEE